MLSTILVPLDGSPLAEQALPVAARLARATGAALHLAHVHVAASLDPISIEGMPVVDEQMRSLAAEHEQVYLERAATQIADASLKPQVARLEGPVAPTLASYARDIGAGLIVMTTHGRSGFAQLWLGSSADALVRVSDTPLLLLRPGPDGQVADRPFRRVLAPLDGSALAEQILPHGAALAAIDGGEILALRIIDSLPVPQAMPFSERFRLDEGTLARERAQAEQYLQGLAAGLAPAQVMPVVREAPQPARAILELAAELGADLLALTTQGRGASSRKPISSVADKVLRGAALPLLILRPRASQAE
jgi:nucleotide-binding universal stress UspA family protein